MSGASNQHEEEVLGKPYDARLMRRILRYLRPYRPSVAFALVCIGLYSVLTSMGPFYTKQAIDRYLAPSARLASHGIVDRWLDRFLSSDPVRGVGQLALLYL
jgi:ATP-binding cassette subfamily B multidrug efflux pump